MVGQPTPIYGALLVAGRPATTNRPESGVLDLVPLGDDVVLLREWTVEDAQWYAETAAHDELIQRYTTESPTLTTEEVRAAIVALLAGPPDRAGFLIADPATGERLGNLALSYEDSVGEVSYWLAAGARGRGAATHAVRVLADWALATLGLRELRLTARADNLGSRAVAERAGFVRDPGRDERREVKGQIADWVAYVWRAADTA
jgi:RimJ/RimL family protein N-acetyltransferase